MAAPDGEESAYTTSGMTRTTSGGSTWDVLAVGANSVDYVYRLPAAPQIQGPCAKMRIGGYRVSCGGQATTMLATIAAMGLRGKYVGVTGRDANGERIRRELVRLGLDIDHTIIRDVPNPHAVILVDDSSGERIVLWHRDDDLAMRPEEYPLGLVPSSRVVHVDDTDQPAAIAVAAAARAAGVPVTSDIDRLTDLTEPLIATVSVPMFAEHVPAALTGESDPERALRKMRRTHDGMLCVTLGPQGAMLLVGDTLYAEPAPRIHAIDTTGAGDVFRGAFVHAWLRGDSPSDILRFANAAAATSCTREGAMSGVPTEPEALRLIDCPDSASVKK
jgi:sugar/nucleoside kinase (ribokinase family)